MANIVGDNWYEDEYGAQFREFDQQKKKEQKFDCEP